MAAPALIGTPGAAVVSPSSVPMPTTLTPPTGSGYAAGDLLLCFTSSWGGFGSTVATPAGWTELLNVSIGTPSSNIVLFGKVAASASEPAPSVVWTVVHGGSGGDPSIAQVAAFRGAASLASLADVVGALNTLSSTFSQSAGGSAITTLTADDRVFSFTVRGGTGAATMTAPSGFAMVTAAVTATSGVNMTHGWASQAKAAPGSVGVPSFGFNGSSSASMGVMVALKAAPVGVTNNDVVTGKIGLTGTRVESYQPPIIHNNAPSAAFKLSGSRVESYVRDYTDAPLGKLTLTGTCVSTHVREYTDNPAGKITLGGTAARTTQRSTTPVGSVKLSGSVVSTTAKEYTDVCAGVLALLGVKSETIAYTDTSTGKLVLSGTATSAHLIIADDLVIGTLRLHGSAVEYVEIEGQIIHDNRPTGTLRLNGRLIVTDVWLDDGIGRAQTSPQTPGRVVGSLGTGRAVGNLTGRLTR